VDNATIANLTGNATDIPTEPTGWGDWIFGIIKFLWDMIWRIFDVASKIMSDNPIIGLIIVILFVILLFWVLTLSQVAAAQGMKLFLYIGIIIVVLFIIWYLHNTFDLFGTFSSLLKGTLGLGGNASIGVENTTNITVPEPSEGINFWK
jgi:O-antigen ligase